MSVFCIVLNYLCGSLMFSYWLGLLAGKDLRKAGDGNPGAFNLWAAAGWRLGLLGVLLDFLKGYLPLFFQMRLGAARDPWFVLIALAPIVGHAFSPFLKFRGGKSIAVTFGVWSAVTWFEVSFVYAVVLALITLLLRLFRRGKAPSSEMDAFSVVFGLLPVGGYLYLKASPLVFWQLWALNLLLFCWLNRAKLFRLFKTVSEGWREKRV